MDGRLGQDEWRAAIVKHLQREREWEGEIRTMVILIVPG